MKTKAIISLVLQHTSIIFFFDIHDFFADNGDIEITQLKAMRRPRADITLLSFPIINQGDREWWNNHTCHKLLSSFAF